MTQLPRAVAAVLLPLSLAAGASAAPAAEVLKPYPLLDFETPGSIPGACFAGAVQEAAPSRGAAHSGQMGLVFHFAGAPGKSGGQYFAVPSDMLAAARGICFWLRRTDGPGRSTMTLTLASDDYQTQWHHPISLDSPGWREFTFPAGEFTVTHPPDVKPDWRRNYWVYFTADGPDPLTVYLDGVRLLVEPGAASVERFVTNLRHPKGNFVFNSRLQVTYTRAEPALISRVTAFRRDLLGAATVVVDGHPLDEAALAAASGKATVEGRETHIGGSVAASGFRVAARVTCEPAAPLTLCLPVKAETYASQTFEIDGQRGLFARGPAGVLAHVDEAERVVLGSLSKRRLALDLGPETTATIHREAGGDFRLDLTSRNGTVDLALSAPSEDIEIKLSTHRYHNVHEHPDAGSIAVNALFHNNTTRNRWCSYDASVTDFEGRRVFGEAASLRLPGGEAVERIFRPQIARLGFYKLVIEATDAITGEQYRRFLTLGVIEPVVRARPPDPSGKFGVHFFARTPEAAHLISRVGITWSRDNIYWDSMEPERGQYNWGPMETYTTNATNAGLWTMPIQAGYGAPWAQRPEMVEDKWGKTPQIDLDAWRKYWSELARRYRGKVGAWEISNETYWAPVSFVVETHRVAYQAIREQDPEVPVLANVTLGYGGTVDYLREFLAAGGAEGCDVISAHPYCGYQASPEQGGMREVGHRVNEIIKPYFRHPRQWWTEYGWMGDDEYDPDLPGVETDWSPNIISERAMAQYIIRAYLAGMASGVERMFYFLDQDTAVWQFPSGLLREEGIRPALCAINTLCRVLEYTDFVREVKLRDDVELMVFRGRGYSAAAVWTTATPERKVTLHVPLPISDLQVTDFMGNTVPMPRGARELGVSFDGSPVYLTSRMLSPEALSDALHRGRVEGERVSVGRIFLGPGRLAVELSNPSDRTTQVALKVLDPQPSTWGLQATSAGAELLAGRSARVIIPRGSTLPPPDPDTILRLQVGAEPVVERGYRFLYAPRARNPIGVADDPATWGAPTATLDQAAQTMSCVSGVASPSVVWRGPSDLSAQVWLRWDEQRLWVGLEVRDDVQHLAVGSPADMWKGDSVQYGFDATGNAPTKPPDGWDATDDSEWVAGLLDGRPDLVRTTAPQGVSIGSVPGVECSVRRTGDVTAYIAGFPWSSLPPATGEEGAVFGLNLIVNDDDGDGRKGWIGITGGMGEAKVPRLFRKVLLQG